MDLVLPGSTNKKLPDDTPCKYEALQIQLRARICNVASLPHHHRSRPQTYPHLLECRSLEGVPGRPGKSQKEGQEDQGTLTQLEGVPFSSFTSPGLPSGLLRSR